MILLDAQWLPQFWVSSKEHEKMCYSATYISDSTSDTPMNEIELVEQEKKFAKGTPDCEQGNPQPMFNEDTSTMAMA